MVCISALDYGTLAKNVFDEINVARANPSKYLLSINYTLNHFLFQNSTGDWLRCAFDPSFDSQVVGSVCNGVVFVVNENSTAPWVTAVQDLTPPNGQFSFPTTPLQFSKGLSESCVPFLLDHGPCGDVAYDSRDHTTYDSRA